MTPEIDDTPINTRTDWTHLPMPDAPQDRAWNTFPGIPQWILAQGPLMPQPIDIAGFLEGTHASDLNLAIVDLQNQFDTLSGVADDKTHKLTLYVEYENSVLESVKRIGSIHRKASNDGHIHVLQGVQARFRQLVFPTP